VNLSGLKASQELTKFVKKTNFPITMTLLGLGSYPASDKQSLGMLGMHGRASTNHAVQGCDLLIAIGARFDDRVTGKIEAFCPTAKIIHMDIDPSSISKNVKVDVPIVGDVGNILKELNKCVKAPKIDAWWKQITEWQTKYPLWYKEDGTIKPQVLIEARIVEVDTNHQKDLGVQWGSRYSADAAHGNALNYGFPNSMQTGIGAGGGWALNAPTAGRTGTGSGGGEAGGTIGLSFGAIDNTISLDLKLSALESKGVSKIISRPRIVTINKQEAKINQGLSIPFVTTSAEGTKTEFIDASLELTVTPEVKQDKSIILSIKVSKNEPDFARAAAGSPSIAKKEAKTMVLIKNGDTTVIGGIFTQKEGESVAGVPILSKIPLIGWLFRSTNKTSDKAELLIFITARIVDDVI